MTHSGGADSQQAVQDSRYSISTDAADIDRDWLWEVLSAHAYWGKWRSRDVVELQLERAWRVVGIFDTASSQQVGYARAVSDGVADAHLADVIVDPRYRGRGVGKLIVGHMIDEGPGRRLRWTLFTADAHGLYEQFGFADPGPEAMVRPASLVATPPGSPGPA